MFLTSDQSVCSTSTRSVAGSNARLPLNKALLAEGFTVSTVAEAVLAGAAKRRTRSMRALHSL